MSRARDALRRHAKPKWWWLTLRGVIYAAGILTAYYVLPIDRDQGTEIGLRLLIGLLVLGVVLAWQIYAVATTEYPRLQAITALALAVPLLLTIFATTYMALSNSDPAAFNERLGHTSSLYFTLTTLATVGYGDIVAKSDAARVSVMLQMVANIAVVAITGRVIFGMVTERRRTPT